MKKVMIIILFLASVLSWSHVVVGQNDSSSVNDQLIQAAMEGDAAAVRQFLEKGANIEYRDHDSYTAVTALMSAAMSGQIEVVKLLLEKGADIETKNSTGCTALFWAALLAKPRS